MKEWLKTCRRKLIAAAIRAMSSPASFDPAGRTTVVAPHPDDEVLACGGLMGLKSAAGATVDVVFLTSGEASHNGCCRADPAAIADRRRAIAREAASSLGVAAGNLHWAGIQDGLVPADNDPGFGASVDRISEILARTKPAEMYCPHPLDCWPDHEAASRIVLAAVRKSGLPVMVRWYLVWGWHGMSFRRLPRLGRAQRLDISSVLPAKYAAINRYTGSGPAGCPSPYIGALPEGFLDPFRKPYEIFFECRVMT